MNARGYLVGIEQDLGCARAPPPMATANALWPTQPADFIQQTLTATGWSGAFKNPPGTPLILTWQCVERSTPQWDLSVAALGGYDDIWRSHLLRILSFNVIGFRIMQERNGDWFQWSRNFALSPGADGTPPGGMWPVSTYIAAFRRAAAVARSVFPYAWIDWCVSAPGLPGSLASIAAGYPGDDVVDVISFDAYQTKWTPDWRSVMTGPVFNPDTISAFAVARGKRTGIGEFATGGCQGLPCSAGFFSEAMAWCDAQGAPFRYVSWYDAGGWDCLWNGKRPDLRRAWNAGPFGTRPFVGWPAPTSYSFFGPSVGGVGQQSDPFIVAAPNACRTAKTITPKVTGGAGTFLPPSVSFPAHAVNPVAKFRFIPAVPDLFEISLSHSPWGFAKNPQPRHYIAG